MTKFPLGTTQVLLITDTSENVFEVAAALHELAEKMEAAEKEAARKANEFRPEDVQPGRFIYFKMSIKEDARRFVVQEGGQYMLVGDDGMVKNHLSIPLAETDLRYLNRQYQKTPRI